MYLLLLGIIVFVIAVIISMVAYHSNGDFFILPISIAVISGTFLLIALIAIPCQRFSIKGDIQGYKALQRTYNLARKSANKSELYALQLKIGAANQEIAQLKYYANNNWVSIYYPPEVKTLKYIK